MPTTLQLLLALAGTQPPLPAVAVDSPPPSLLAPQQLRAVRLSGGPLSHQEVLVVSEQVARRLAVVLKGVLKRVTLA